MSEASAIWFLLAMLGAIVSGTAIAVYAVRGGSFTLGSSVAMGLMSLGWFSMAAAARRG